MIAFSHGVKRDESPKYWARLFFFTSILLPTLTHTTFYILLSTARCSALHQWPNSCLIAGTTTCGNMFRQSQGLSFSSSSSAPRPASTVGRHGKQECGSAFPCVSDASVIFANLPFPLTQDTNILYTSGICRLRRTSERSRQDRLNDEIRHPKLLDPCRTDPFRRVRVHVFRTARPQTQRRSIFDHPCKMVDQSLCPW